MDGTQAGGDRLDIGPDVIRPRRRKNHKCDEALSDRIEEGELRRPQLSVVYRQQIVRVFRIEILSIQAQRRSAGRSLLDVFCARGLP